MLEATQKANRKLLKNEGRMIDRKLLTVKLELEDLYRSEKAQVPKEEFSEYLTKFLDILERIRVNQNVTETLDILFDEYYPLAREIRVKYSNFLSDTAIERIELEEKHLEAIKNYSSLLTAFELAYEEPDNSIRFWKIYSCMVRFSELLEQYISYFSDGLLEIGEGMARMLLEDSVQQLEGTDLSQETTNSLKFIKNTARGILWQIENYQKDKKYPVEELLDWLELAPGWAGDDFDECLDYVNQVRK